MTTKPEIWRGPVKHTNVETGVESLHWWIKCPDCQNTGQIDEDQAHGRVSIQCECGYHETHNLVTA